MKTIYLFFFGMFVGTLALSAQNDINKLDSNGKRHGLWKKYYANKQLRYEGTFDHGKEIGTFKFYCEICKDQPEVVKEFSKDGTASVKFYSKEGKLMSEGRMNGKNKMGVWIFYAEESETPIMQENYKNGVLDGEKLLFYPDGSITEKLLFVNGVQEGESLFYSPKGIVLKQLTFSNNKLNGPAIYRDASGNITMKGNYKDGQNSGTWLFYKNGRVLFDKTY
ncbi:toxin-antitoxin system YwqK family antitoxin [Jejudonia soesokkakensis]|uniref:Toxin-antitoxin system YwqK family antitoxin n=1 Tax=Jejudonia soesokkakensis TaxID=1323432 RepID=A0ABW2MX82_9FLAO